MPIYEYRCQSCNAVSEAFVRNGKEPSKCPECGAESLTRLISRAGVIFKGSGFYVTDSKASTKAVNTPSPSKSSSESTSKDAAPATASTESASSSDKTSTSSKASKKDSSSD